MYSNIIIILSNVFLFVCFFLGKGAISGIAIAAAAAVVLMIASILAILLIIKICTPLHGSVAHGCDQENVVSASTK